MAYPEPVILVVEDDLNDQRFIQRALKQSGVVNPVLALQDGEEATAYLAGVESYADREKHPLPRLIITDLKLPRMGGIELLRWMNERPAFRAIPTVVLTSSYDQVDIARAYEHGAKGYMIKPVQFGELERLMQVVTSYWRESHVPSPPRE